MNAGTVAVFLALCGLFLIAAVATSVLEKIGQHGPDMAKTLMMIVFVIGVSITVGVLTSIVFQVKTTFNVF